MLISMTQLLLTFKQDPNPSPIGIHGNSELWPTKSRNEVAVTSFFSLQDKGLLGCLQSMCKSLNNYSRLKKSNGSVKYIVFQWRTFWYNLSVNEVALT